MSWCISMLDADWDRAAFSTCAAMAGEVSLKLHTFTEGRHRWPADEGRGTRMPVNAWRAENIPRGCSRPVEIAASDGQHLKPLETRSL